MRFGHDSAAVHSNRKIIQKMLENFLMKREREVGRYF